MVLYNIRRGAAVMLHLCMLLCCACETESESVGKSVECSINVEFAVDGRETGTRAVAEAAVHDINLYVVNAEGQVLFSGYYRQGGGVQATIHNGESFMIYAIANAGGELKALTASEIESLVYTRNEPGMLSAYEGSLLMSGTLPYQELEAGSTVTVPLTRCAAKVFLKCDYSGLNSDVTIDVSSVRLRNIPCHVGIFKESRIISSDGAKDGEPLLNPEHSALEEGVSFYLMENMQGNLQPGNTMQSGKVWPEGSLNSQICSYVEIMASYLSPRKKGDIIYRFYLGKDMLSNYDVQRNSQYDITISFNGDGALDENSWRVDVSGITDAVPPEIELSELSRVMYDYEEALLTFSSLKPEGAQVSATSSDPAVVQVKGCSSAGIEVLALAPGTATIVAESGGVSSSCTITVEKLRIVPARSYYYLYNHFYTDITYVIYPEHAGRALKGQIVSASSNYLNVRYGDVSNRVIPQFPADNSFSNPYALTLGIIGRDDVTATAAVYVYPMLTMYSAITVNANMGSTKIVKSLGMSASSRARITLSWVPSDGVSIYGDPGDDNVELQAVANIAKFAVPNGANGKYRLKANVIGDDGYGNNEAIHTDAVRYCDITIYETIYLMGISKTIGKEKIDSNPDKWRYQNEVVAKWLSHPKSLMYPNGEVDLNLGFIYNGVTYNDNHTELLENFEFTFERGEEIQYALDAGTAVYNGTPPPYYLEYFYLQPAVSPYVQGSLTEGKPYLYIYSRNFASGFSDGANQDWERIFDYVY